MRIGYQNKINVTQLKTDVYVCFSVSWDIGPKQNITSRKMKIKDTSSTMRKSFLVWLIWHSIWWNMTYYSDLPLTRTEVCSVGVEVGQPAHYAIMWCPRCLTMATGSHSAVLIATSHSCTFTDHTNLTSKSGAGTIPGLEDFILDKDGDIGLRWQDVK